MNQHSAQKAYLKSFEDKSGRLWVYSKSGGKPFPKPAGECAAEEDFQSKDLEFYQQRMIETPGIKALRAEGSLTDLEYEQASLWMALHIIRNAKARRELFKSAEEYEQRFPLELEKERLFANYYTNVYTHVCDDPKFLITSDNPVIEFQCDDFFMRCCPLFPRKVILFSPHSGKLDHEAGLEEFINAMVWGATEECIYSHRKDLAVERLQAFTQAYGLDVLVEDISFTIAR
jgi:hypothetical protein